MGTVKAEAVAALPDARITRGALGLALGRADALNVALLLGVFAPALSTFYLGVPGPPGLLLGYTGVSEQEIRAGVRRLAQDLT